MNMKERRKGPIRRGARGRPPARRDGEGGILRRRGERGDQNWTKKFEEGEIDDLFDADAEEADLDGEGIDLDEEEER